MIYSVLKWQKSDKSDSLWKNVKPTVNYPQGQKIKKCFERLSNFPSIIEIAFKSFVFLQTNKIKNV